MPIPTILFWCFSLLMLGSALMVVVSQHPVKSVLFLVLTFFAATGLWLLLTAEFLALVLILVYVGAVMTLFLFVVMTIQVDFNTLKQPFLRYYVPMGLVMAALLGGLLFYAIEPTHSVIPHMGQMQPVAQIGNTTQLGELLYTQYIFPFEITAVILLVAMIAAISLTLSDPIRRKQQNVSDQVKARKEDRVRLVK